MDGITAISQRMAAIQATISSMSAPRGRPLSDGTGAQFSQVLSEAVASSAATGAAASGARRTADGIPADLAAYGNGKIPPAALKKVGTTGHKLWAPAGEALESLMAAAARDGVKIGITDSYRSYDAQVDVAARKGLYSQGGLAANPGTSPHGWGMAVDLDLNDRAQSWMRANAGRFGFVEDTPREPWHWVYRA